jgi:HlyD family secretion protein
VDIVPGELVSSSTSAITLVDLSALYIDVSVDELDIAEVEVGQNALISPDALDDTTLDGQVARIAPVGTNEDGIVTFDVRINLSNIDGLPVRVGMTTDVEILVGSEAAALVVPTQAIQRSGESEFVQLYNDDGTTTDVPVTTGTTSDGMTVVQGDLTEGVRVVLPPDTQAQQGGSPFGG